MQRIKTQWWMCDGAGMCGGAGVACGVGIVSIVLVMLFTACSDGGGQTEANDPVAIFNVAVIEAASSFVAQTTNKSRNHDGGSIDLAHSWTADQQHPTNEFSPQFIWTYFQLFGSRSEEGDQALRKITLDVIEGGDAERVSTASETLLLERAATGVTVSAVGFVGSIGRTINDRKCRSKPQLYKGQGDYAFDYEGFAYRDRWYCVVYTFYVGH